MYTARTTTVTTTTTTTTQQIPTTTNVQVGGGMHARIPTPSVPRSHELHVQVGGNTSLQTRVSSIAQERFNNQGGPYRHDPYISRQRGIYDPRQGGNDPAFDPRRK